MRETQPRNKVRGNRNAPPVPTPVQRTAVAAAQNSNIIWLCLGLIAVNLFIYAGVWTFDFVNYDDPGYFDNSYVGTGLTWQGVSWAFRTGSMYNWHPLTWLSYMLDVQLFGLHPAVLHTTNLVLHIASTLLLFLALNQMTGMAGRSSFVAGMFAAHPLHVESV